VIKRVAAMMLAGLIEPGGMDETAALVVISVMYKFMKRLLLRYFLAKVV
jgi:hypothetical protein